MGIINGHSHKAIKYFRDEPAALAVYWIYCSRVNNEGVAWPSIRGLAESTGWSKQTVTNARKWLVERGALEPVADYTRPQWRNLPPAEQNKKKGLNRSEYYRVTGIIYIDGTRYDLLYIPGHTPASELEVPDVLPGRTPTVQDAYAVGRLPDRTELSISPELSTSPELDTTTTSGVVIGFLATPDEREAIHEATEKALRLKGSAYGLVEKYANFLAGRTPERAPAAKGMKARSNGKWYEYQVTPGMDAAEIYAFGNYMASYHPDIEPLRKPETINDYAARFRNHPEHDALVKRMRGLMALKQEQEATLPVAAGAESQPPPVMATPEQIEQAKAAFEDLMRKKRG